MLSIAENQAAGLQVLELQPQNDVKNLNKKEFSVSFADVLNETRKESEGLSLQDNQQKQVSSKETEVHKSETADVKDRGLENNEQKVSDDVKENESDRLEKKITEKDDVKNETAGNVPSSENQKSSKIQVISDRIDDKRYSSIKKENKNARVKNDRDLNLENSQSILDRLVEISEIQAFNNVSFDENTENLLREPIDLENMELEIEDVSDVTISLDSAQSVSVNNPEAFLKNTTENIVSKDEDSTKVKSKIKVEDRRTVEVEPGEKIPGIDGKGKGSSEMNVEAVLDTKDSATITMSVNQENLIENNILSSNNQSASADGSNFQAMLSNQIANNAEDFVKAGKIILRDNDKGTINLVLHPDDLGNVKIQLSLDGKNISGKILVATKEAMEVFKDNAQSLKEAFVNNGFENAGFDVSYQGQSSAGQQNFAKEQQQRINLQNANYAYSDSAGSDGNKDYVNLESRGNNLQYSVNIVA